jgi:RimJ/RimL family protein N-acetyltransferase
MLRPILIFTLIAAAQMVCAGPEDRLEQCRITAAENVGTLQLFTARLSLRPLGPDQVDEVATVLLNPKTQDMSGDRPTLTSLKAALEDSQQTLENLKAIKRPRVIFGIYQGGVLVGTANLTSAYLEYVEGRVANPGEKWISIGYHLRPECWGQGLASEAVERVLRFAFQDLGMSGIHAFALRTNVGSQNVLRKAGFTEFDAHDVNDNHFYLKSP